MVFLGLGRAVVVGIDVVDDADHGPARRGGYDGRLLQPGELGAGHGELVGVGAEEGQVLGEAQDATADVVVAVLLLGRADQLAEGVGGCVQLVGGQGREAGVVVDAVGDEVQGPAGGRSRVGQVGRLGQAQCREAGEQQVLAESGGQIGGEIRAVGAGGGEAGVLEGPGLGPVQGVGVRRAPPTARGTGPASPSCRWGRSGSATSLSRCAVYQ